MDNSLFRGRLIKVSCFVSECLPTTNTPACTGDTKKDKHSWFQSWTRAWWRIPWRISGWVPGRLIRIYSLPCAWQVGSQTILARVLSLTWIKIVGAAVGATNYSKRTSNLWLALYSIYDCSFGRHAFILHSPDIYAPHAHVIAHLLFVCPFRYRLSYCPYTGTDCTSQYKPSESISVGPQPFLAKGPLVGPVFQSLLRKWRIHEPLKCVIHAALVMRGLTPRR